MDLEKIFQDIIIQRYENNPVKENNLTYHNWKHTHDVYSRALKIEEILLETAFLHEKDLVLMKYAALGHDLVQDFECKDAPNKIGKIRVYKTGQNEEKSAEETIKIAKEYTQLSLEDEKTIRDAILITIPEWDSELQTVYQPNLRTVPTYVSLCVALADLGYTGMDSEKDSIKVGNLLFKEQRLLPNLGKLSSRQKTLLIQEINELNLKEVHFYEGRKIRFQKEIVRVSNISWKVIDEINLLFSNFDKNIEAEKVYYEKCKNMSFEGLIKTFDL